MSKLSLNLVERRLSVMGLTVFTIDDFSKVFKIKPSTARAFLSRNSKKESSYFSKLKRGIYAFNLNSPTKFEIANKLYKPSYVSFETALSYYGVIPEIVYEITSATTKQTKAFNVQNSIFNYLKIKKILFFGYQSKRIQGRTVLIADKEKALLDYLYLLSLKKRPFNERIDLKKIDTQKLGYYVRYYKENIKKNKAFINLVKKIYKPL